MTDFEKPKLKLIDDKYSAILAAARSVMKRNGNPDDQIERFMKEAMSGDYQHLINTCRRWFEIT